MPLTGPKYQAMLALLQRAPSAAADLTYLKKRFSAVGVQTEKPGRGMLRIIGTPDAPAPRLALALCCSIFTQRYYESPEAPDKARDRREEYVEKMHRFSAELRWHEGLVALELWRASEAHVRAPLLECGSLRILFSVGCGVSRGKSPTEAQLARLGDPEPLRTKWHTAFFVPSLAKHGASYGKAWDDAHPEGSPVPKPARLKLRSLAQRRGLPSQLDDRQHPSHARLKELVAHCTSYTQVDETLFDELTNHLKVAELLVPSAQPEGTSHSATDGERWSFNVLACGRELWLPTFTDLSSLLACQPNWVSHPYVAMRGADIARMIAADGKALWTLNPTADRPGLVLSHVFSGRVVPRLAAALP